MAEQFDAGSVYVQFKAVAQQVIDAANRAGDSVSKFGNRAATTAKKVEQSGNKISSTFAKINKESASLAGRAASMGQRLIGVQLAMQTVVGTAGEMSVGMRTAAQSFSAFAAIVSVFPSPLGLVVAGVAALVVALKGLLGPSEEAKKALEEQKKAAEDARVAYADLAKQIAAFNVQVVKERAVGTGLVEQAIRREQRQLAIYEKALLDQEAKLLIMYKGVRGEAGADPVTQKEYEAQLNLVKGLRDQVTEITETIELRKRAVAEADKEHEARKAAIQAQKEYNKQFKAEADETRRVFLANQKAEEQAEIDAIMEATERAVEGEDARYQKRLADLAALEEAEKEYVDAVLSYEDAAREMARLKREQDIAQLTQQFKDRFAAPFAYSISSALQEGIMTGMSAMDSLKNFGEKIFADMVGGFAKDLQTTLTDTISKIAGAAGEEIGGVIQGLVGIAGFFLSGRGRGSGTQRFGQGEGVTSTQAVRGVVAGPTNIAISAVGDNLSRSMVPIVERMDVIIGILRSYQGRGGTGGGVAYAGSVPTP
jgi:hypothetical protein